MKICVIGWYGTETIGDRAILAGLISVFSEVFSYYDITLGSLYPFFSKRTILEDSSLWKEFTGKQINIAIFDTHSRRDLLKAIKECDLLVMGGGPLMDIQEMYMVEYAFRKAKLLGKKTAILGCGVGPIYKDKFKKELISIVRYSDIVILRDEESIHSLRNIAKQEEVILADKIEAIIDPAVFCIQKYIHLYPDIKPSQNICVNLREFPSNHYNSSKTQVDEIYNYLLKVIRYICQSAHNHKVILVPMHYFWIGGDDRELFGRIKEGVKESNLCIQNKPLSLYETMKIFQEAKWCVGMRFHSVLFQTLLNGHNFILDYTEPDKGKTAGLISTLNMKNFYCNRYISLLDQAKSLQESFSFREIDKHFIVQQEILESLRQKFISKFKTIISV